MPWYNYSLKAKLKCYYSHGNNPYLTYAPFKSEVVFLSPKIVIYYEVLSDDEINTIKTLATPRVSLIQSKIQLLNQ